MSFNETDAQGPFTSCLIYFSIARVNACATLKQVQGDVILENMTCTSVSNSHIIRQKVKGFKMKRIILFLVATAIGLSAQADYTVQTTQPTYPTRIAPFNFAGVQPYNQNYPQPYNQTYAQGYNQNPYQSQYANPYTNQYANPYAYSGPYGNNLQSAAINSALGGLGGTTGGTTGGATSIMKNIVQSIIYSKLRGY